MKRTIILAIGILAVSAATTFAQSPTTPQPPAGKTVGANFVDANGDGICDNFQSGTRQGNGMARRGKRLGPQDGSGYGVGSGAMVGSGNGTGVCDGTGPKGTGRGRGRR